MRKGSRGIAVAVVCFVVMVAGLADAEPGGRWRAALSWIHGGANTQRDQQSSTDATTPSRRRAVVHPGSNLPVAVADNYTATQAATLTIAAPGVLANDTVAGGHIASYGVNGNEQATLGSATPTGQGGTVIVAADGSLVYQSAATFSGTDSFKYELSGGGSTSTASVTITVVPAAPTAVADAYQANSGQALSVAAPGVLGNDTLNGATIASFGATGTEETGLGVQTLTAHGAVTLNANGSFSYTSNEGFSGDDHFSYVLQNGGGTSKGVVTVTVAAQNAVDFVVTTPGFFYSFSGLSGENPVLELKEGRTYRFQVNAAPIHPFEILGAPSGSVTGNHTTNGIVTFTVPVGGSGMRYHCAVHDFGNDIVTTP